MNPMNFFFFKIPPALALRASFEALNFVQDVIFPKENGNFQLCFL